MQKQQHVSKQPCLIRDYTLWIPGNDLSVRDGAADYSAGSYNGVIADVGHDYGSLANPRPIADCYTLESRIQGVVMCQNRIGMLMFPARYTHFAGNENIAAYMGFTDHTIGPYVYIIANLGFPLREKSAKSDMNVVTDFGEHAFIEGESHIAS